MIIGLSGKRGVGKSTLARHFVEKHGFVHLSFANRLREMAKEVFEFSDRDLSDPKLKETPWDCYDWTPRGFLIEYGQFVRKFDTDYWCRSLLKSCLPTVNYIIDDVRFENEYKMIENYGGKIWRIVRRPPHNIYKDNLDNISETALDKAWFDYIIVNEDTLELFYSLGDTGYGVEETTKGKMLPLPTGI